MNLRFLPTFARGFCMGAADVVPGVSGGTMAFILGIYERLIRAISSFDLLLIRHLAGRRWRQALNHTDLAFLAVLGAGIVSALFFFTRVVPLPTLIRTDPEPVFGLFLGLVLGSVYVLLKNTRKLGAKDFGFLFCGVFVGGVVVTLAPVSTPEAPWFVFLSGMLAISAMILPGVSGSFILLVLRKYAYVFDAIGRLDFAVIIPFGLGAVVGLMLFSRVLTWLMEHHRRPVTTAIIGFLVSSLWVIWPFQHRVYSMVRGKQRLLENHPQLPQTFDGTTVLALVMIITGLVLVVVLDLLARRAQERGG